MAIKTDYGSESQINYVLEQPRYIPRQEIEYPTGGGGGLPENGGGGGRGLMGQPTAPTPISTAPTPVPAPPAGATPPPITTPAGPSTPVPAPTPAPAPAPVTTPLPPPTPMVAGPDPNWQQNVQRPTSQSGMPAMPTPSTPNIPPASQGGVYAPSYAGGTNPHLGTANTAGTGAAGVGDFRGIFGEGDRGAATRAVQENELSGAQLNDLIQGDSQYIRNARLLAAQRASEGGMLMSTMAAGAGSRAAIDAAQPFAMQQADAYGRAATENMAAQNADALADQGQFRDMGARDIALRAQMEDASLGRQFQAGQAQNEQAWRSGESELDRNFNAGENAANRTFTSAERAAGQTWQSGESAYDRAWRGDQAGLDRYQQTSERLGAQDFQSAETAYDRAFREYQLAMDRAQQTNERLGAQDFSRYERYGTQDFQRGMSEDEQGWRSGEAALDRNYNTTQAEMNRDEVRYNTYFQSVANREAHTATVLNAIYSNPNLTPQQQQLAADNARAMLTSIYNGYNTVMANGIPPIFADPYPMTFPTSVTPNATP